MATRKLYDDESEECNDIREGWPYEENEYVPDASVTNAASGGSAAAAYITSSRPPKRRTVAAILKVRPSCLGHRVGAVIARPVDPRSKSPVQWLPAGEQLRSASSTAARLARPNLACAAQPSSLPAYLLQSHLRKCSRTGVLGSLPRRAAASGRP